VRIDLVVRGICCLRPGLPGLSENVRVVSIIDRFLEHARVYRFENRGAPEVWLASADWMPRNLGGRIEAAFPVVDPDLRAEIEAVLELELADDVKGRIIRPDGTSARRDGAAGIRSQAQLVDLATVAARRSAG
jgi:polyphosphate kinase